MSKITLRDISENESTVGDMNRYLGYYRMTQQKLASVVESDFGTGLTSAGTADLGKLFQDTAEEIRHLMQNYIEITWAIIKNYQEIDEKLGSTERVTGTK